MQNIEKLDNNFIIKKIKKKNKKEGKKKEERKKKKQKTRSKPQFFSLTLKIHKLLCQMLSHH